MDDQDGQTKYRLSDEQLIFEQTKLLNYLKVVEQELRSRELRPQQILWKSFLQSIENNEFNSNIRFTPPSSTPAAVAVPEPEVL